MAKYHCKECGQIFMWLEDFINHVKKAHAGKQPLVYRRLWEGKSLADSA